MGNPYPPGSILILSLLIAVPAESQSPSRRPSVALTVGLGNVLGGLGAGVEHYLARSHASVSAGLGYWPSGDLCSSGTLSGAGALRGFLGGGRHRGFAEVSYSLLGVACSFGSDDLDRQYGPGFSLGYRYTGNDGFTFTAGGGIGDVPGQWGTEAMVLLSLGYTWQN
jgi:hypothetical protein